MINQYKRLDVFKCNYPSHARYENRVSVYHVLKDRKCFPQGCIYFQWRCQLLNKGESCVRGYSHVGRKCFGCKYFYDEKINNQPQVSLREDDFKIFQEELRDFENWLEEIKDKEINFCGVIDSVKPRFQKLLFGTKSEVKLQGFILTFREGYIGRVHFEDFCYGVIGKNQQSNHKFSPGDELEFNAALTMDQGRVILKKARRVDFLKKSQIDSWSEGKALVALKTATWFERQPERCLTCEKGSLVDVFEKNAYEEKRYRQLLCLEGINDPQYCYFCAEKILDSDGCIAFGEAHIT